MSTQVIRSYLANNQQQHLNHFIYSSTRNILMGGGLAYAIHSANYTHIPIPLIFPSQYAGYHIVKNLYQSYQSIVTDTLRILTNKS